MIEALITSKTRIKLLLKFFLNTQEESYLRSLENDFNESTNAIRIELNKLEEAGLLYHQIKETRKYSEQIFIILYSAISTALFRNMLVSIR